MRPTNMEQYVGQKHLIGKGAVLQNAVESGRIPSMILWGPPGVGKTSLAVLISQLVNREMFMLSAVHSGVKDVAQVLEKAKSNMFSTSPPILFIDEIHRFNKAQQDAV
ncbi:MAG: AAA family ATPase, partial [Bacteroidales bacterium]